MKNWRYWVIAIVVLMHLGCASSGSGQKNFAGDGSRFFQAGDFERSYRSLEDALGSSDSATRLSAYDFIVAHPELKSAAARTFEPAALRKTFTTFDPSTALSVEQVRLSWYSKFASDEEISHASANIESALAMAKAARATLSAVRQDRGQALIVNEAVFFQLNAGDREKIKALHPSLQVVPVQSVGKLVSHQVIDKSKPSSIAGAQLGAAVGQAAYIDQSFRRSNYSAVGQVGAGLVGAVVGSSLDRPAETRFLINYGIETMDGTVKGLLTSSLDGIASPNGQCVFASDATEAPNYLCTDTLVGFLQRTKKFNVVGVTPDNVGLQVRCKIDGVGALSLSREDCGRLGGQVSD